MLSRMLAYGQKIFGLMDLLDGLEDGREKPEIPARVFPKALLILWLASMPSPNASDQFRKQTSLRRFLRHPMPCGDQIGNFTEVFDVRVRRFQLVLVGNTMVSCNYSNRGCPDFQPVRRSEK